MSFDLLLALSWSDLRWWIDVIVKVAVALGAVIFVHELGHFLMAKACGVKVEKFMIGFDIAGYKLSRKWGETLYGIGILPLGGYVKMFGQDDDPAHIAEQMQKSQIDATSGNAVQITGPSGEKYFVDRRSYLAKSVPQRMAIISAGVIMNVIFAFIFAVIAYGMGVEYVPSIISGTVPGSPAWKAGLEPGDEIVQLGERENPTFMQLRGGVTLGDLEEGILCKVRRASTGKVDTIRITPTQEAGALATVGIIPPQTVTLYEEFPLDPDSAAAKARLVSSPDGIKVESKLQPGDTIVGVGDAAIENYRQFSAELVKAVDKPLIIRVRRADKKAEDDIETAAAAPTEQELSFEVETQPLRQLGVVMKMGPITAVLDDSPAKSAGMEVGDLILQVDGKPIVDGNERLDGWNPITLPEYLRKAAVEGREVEFTVQRKTDGQPDSEQTTIRVTPIVPVDVQSPVPAGSDAIGIAYTIKNEVHAILPSGPAAAVGMKTGDRIVGAKVDFPDDYDGEMLEPELLELRPEGRHWAALMSNIQFAPAGTQVELRFLRGNDPEPQKVTLVPQPADGMFIGDRGFVFEPIIRERKAKTFSEQISYGWDETIDSLTMVFRFLQKLGGQVPVTMLGGPGTIAAAAGGAASQGLSSLLIFLTMLSANLAVINILPIPILDGGHLMFLTYEGIRGRPANERFVLAMHMAGFVFIIGLMLFVIGLDIQRFVTFLT